MGRIFFIAALFLTMTPLLVSLQWLLDKFNLAGWGFICCNYYRLLAILLRIRVRIEGAPVSPQAVLFISNHVSWIDIVVIGSIRPVAFVAKHEVEKWPLIGVTAKMQRTVFVDRQRRQQTYAAIRQIVQRLKSGTSVVLFAEGTSSDGNRVLPFRSALLGAIEQMSSQDGVTTDILVQPMSISYVGHQGMPMGRQQRSLVAWYGALDFVPHLIKFIRRGVIEVVVSYGEPVQANGTINRKEMSRRLEETVRAMMIKALRGGRASGRVAAQSTTNAIQISNTSE